MREIICFVERGKAFRFKDLETIACNSVFFYILKISSKIWKNTKKLSEKFKRIAIF
jgi:hypothetical protein